MEFTMVSILPWPTISMTWSISKRKCYKNEFANIQRNFNADLELRNVLCIGGVHVAASTENENGVTTNVHPTKKGNNKMVVFFRL